MSFKAILFDVDGMVIRSKKFSTQMQEQYGVSWDTMKPFFAGPFQACKIGKADLKEELSHVMKDWRWNNTVESLMKFWFEGGLEVNEQMTNLVSELREHGTRCYLSTNQEKHRLAFLRDEVGLGSLFDDIFSSCEIGHTKNESVFFEHVYKTLHAQDPSLQRSEILFADDHEENTTVAERAGFQTHLYKDFEAFEKLVI
ncbi:HAD hydrolase-like protein [Patescibacteria group bacterium]|nr:HAD hydrolase-like protein [Patescibacteria group bacterium]MBP9709429.1 HAD hydrolase-like protein [Patescibacteria group bacterium]